MKFELATGGRRGWQRNRESGGSSATFSVKHSKGLTKKKQQQNWGSDTIGHSELDGEGRPKEHANMRRIWCVIWVIAGFYAAKGDESGRKETDSRLAMESLCSM